MNDMSQFTYELGEYFRECYRRGFLDGQDDADGGGNMGKRNFNDDAVDEAAVNLRRLAKLDD